MFQAPLIWGDKDDRRRVAWHELFYDLFFVSIIFQLSHSLIYVKSLSEILTFVAGFIAAWWVWASLTHYYKRFETYGLEKRIGTFLLMIPTAGLAIFAPNMLTDNYVPFVISYIVARVFMGVLWYLAGVYNKSFKETAHYLVSGFVMALGLMVMSLLVDDTGVRYIFFFSALLVDFLTPIIFLTHKKSVVKSHANSKLPERYGLFTLIVLGETIAGSVSIAQTSHGVNGFALTVALLGVAIGFSLWWIYHDFIARRLPSKKPFASLLWGYAHLPMMMFLSLMGVGLSRLSSITLDTLESLSLTHLFVVLSVSGFLVTVSIIELLLDNDVPNESSHPVWSPLLKLVSGVSALWIGLLMIAISSPTIPLFLVLFCFLLIQMVYSAATWFHHPIKRQNDFVGQVVKITKK